MMIWDKIKLGFIALGKNITRENHHIIGES